MGCSLIITTFPEGGKLLNYLQFTPFREYWQHTIGRPFGFADFQFMDGYSN